MDLTSFDCFPILPSIVKLISEFCGVKENFFFAYLMFSETLIS